MTVPILLIGKHKQKRQEFMVWYLDYWIIHNVILIILAGEIEKLLLHGVMIRYTLNITADLDVSCTPFQILEPWRNHMITQANGMRITLIYTV